MTRLPFVLRDDYDKEVKQAKELQRRRHTTTPRRPRRPDIPVYNPRQRRKIDVTLFRFLLMDASKCDVCLIYLFIPPDGSEPGTGTEAEEWNESGSSTETETQGTELFWLDYQADSGTITSFLVHKVNPNTFAWQFWLFGFSTFVLIPLCCLFFKADEPEKVVERVAEKNILNSAMRAALEVRIQKEIDKRRDKRWMIFSNWKWRRQSNANKAEQGCICSSDFLHSFNTCVVGV